MATFILVHGGMHGGWCWESVALRLSAAGHRALTPDLPGMGVGQTPPQHVSLELSADFIAGLARAQPERVVLVAHSLGGITITEAAERAPEAVSGLVYITAVLLPSGAAAMATLRHAGDLPPGLRLSADGATLTIDPKYARERYYNGCAEADVRSALARLVPQPTRPMVTPVHHTSARFGSLPRAYIECLNDNCLSIENQRSMRAALPCSPVFTMQTGHSPFLHAPGLLADYLISASEAFRPRFA